MCCGPWSVTSGSTTSARRTAPQLGATYADLYPNRVGRMVLDGGVDPSLSYADAVADQLEALEGALRDYAADCGDREECPLRGSTDERVAQVGGVLDDAAERPLRTDGERDVPLALALTGVVSALYDEASWPVLDTALTEALSGDGDTLLRLADAYVRRDPDGGYSANVIEANAAVACLDTPVDDSREAMAALERRLERVAPTLGAFSAYGEVLCGQWPVPPTGEPQPRVATGLRADPRGGDDRRPGDPVPVVGGARRPARRGAAADVRGRGAHRVPTGFALRRRLGRGVAGARRDRRRRHHLRGLRPHPVRPGAGRLVCSATVEALPRPRRLSSVGQSDSLVMNRSRVRFP